MRLAWPGPAGDGWGEGWPSGGITRLLRSADSPEEIIVATHETGHVRLCPFDGRSPFLRAVNERWDKRHPDQRRYLWGIPSDFSFHPDTSNFERSIRVPVEFVFIIVSCSINTLKYVRFDEANCYCLFLLTFKEKHFSLGLFERLFPLDWEIWKKGIWIKIAFR